MLVSTAEHMHAPPLKSAVVPAIRSVSICIDTKRLGAFEIGNNVVTRVGPHAMASAVLRHKPALNIILIVINLHTMLESDD